MHIALSYQSGISIYEQIKEQIKTAILSGELTEGEMLPSIRQLAKDLKVSVITTTRAYSDLEQEGFIYTVPGKGCFISGNNFELIKEQLLREVEVALSTAIRQGKKAGLTMKELHDLMDILEENNG